MSKRTTGVLLITLSAVLYATRYLSAAIFGSSLNNWSAELFDAMLQYVGSGLVTWSIIALVAGILYLAWAEIGAWRSGTQEEAGGQNTSLKLHIEELQYVIQAQIDKESREQNE